MRTVKARFPGNKAGAYSYLVPEGDNPEVGDLLLTSIGMATEREMKSYMGRNWDGPSFDIDNEDVIVAQPKIATVVEVEVVENLKATKFYMQLLSAKQIKARQAENKVVAAKLKIRRDVEAQLDQLLDSQDKTERYTKLAEVNPDAKRLMEILAGLQTKEIGNG